MKHVYYKVEKRDDKVFNVIKCYIDAGRSWMASDEKEMTVALCPSKFIADYVAAAFDFLWKSKNIDAEDYSIVEANYGKTNASELAFKYCADSVGNGWALHNAYKLLNDKLIEMWLAGSMRFGVLPLDKINEDELKTKLKNAIDACIKTYLHSA